jgi:ABC-2 family transporter protein
VLPVLVGVFVGAPLLSRELETGTYRFAFTQGIGRRRYLLTTLAILAAYVALGAIVLGVVLGGWGHPFEVVGTESRWQAGLFATTWPVLAGWSLVALALGVLCGAVIKKTVTAMGTTAVVVGGLVLGSFHRIIALRNCGLTLEEVGRRCLQMPVAA